MLNLSQRARIAPASPIRKLVPLADAAKKRGVKVYHLNIGDPDFATPKPIINKLKKIAGNIKTISYANFQGIEEHLQSWVKYYQDIGIPTTKEEIRTLLDLANKYNLFVIADETYRGLCFDGKKSYSLLHLTEAKEVERIIICDSLSKRLNICGARLGAIISKNKDIMSAVLRFSQTRLSSSLIERKRIKKSSRAFGNGCEKICSRLTLINGFFL